MKKNVYDLVMMWDIIESLSEEEQKKWLKAFQREMKFKEPLTYQEAEDEITFGCRDKEALRALIKIRPEDERPVHILAEYFGIVKGVPKNIDIFEVEWKLRDLIRNLFLRKAPEDLRWEYRRGELSRVSIELENLETFSVDEFGEIHRNGNPIPKKDVYFIYKRLKKAKPLFIRGDYKTPLWS